MSTQLLDLGEKNSYNKSSYMRQEPDFSSCATHGTRSYTNPKRVHTWDVETSIYAPFHRFVRHPTCHTIGAASGYAKMNHAKLHQQQDKRNSVQLEGNRDGWMDDRNQVSLKLTILSLVRSPYSALHLGLRYSFGLAIWLPWRNSISLVV